MVTKIKVPQNILKISNDNKDARKLALRLKFFSFLFDGTDIVTGAWTSLITSLLSQHSHFYSKDPENGILASISAGDKMHRRVLVYRQLGDSNSQWHKKILQKVQLGNKNMGKARSELSV